MKDLELYIHIPFCKSKCYYCDFCSTSSQKYMDEYMSKLVIEAKKISSRLNDYVVKSIFIGGGTPSMLPDGYLLKTVSNIKEYFNLDVKEFTVECNPESISEEKLIELKELVVNRLSIGVQTLNDKILKLLNRIHTKDIAIEKVKLAKKYFSNVSIDMMIGLPNQTNDDISFIIKTFSDIGVKHISCYTLQLEEKTVLKKMVDEKKVVMKTDDEISDMYNYAVKTLSEYGFNRYEISNFQKDNHYSMHNLGYWKRVDYIGLGVSAHSLINNVRFSNTNSLQKYLNGSEYESEAKLSFDDRLFEEIMLGLRLTEGIDIKYINEKYDIDFCKKYEKQLKYLSKFIILSDNNIRIKDKYFEVSNSIIVEFMD